jgi:hypothetical protein
MESMVHSVTVVGHKFLVEWQAVNGDPRGVKLRDGRRKEWLFSCCNGAMNDFGSQ